MHALTDPSNRGLDPDLVGRLHARADAARWGIAIDRFAIALARAVAKTNATAAAGAEAGAALARAAEALHVADLALAMACADGHEAAWETFLATYRVEMQRAAAAIAGGDHGQDLADALVADLFGLDPKGTGRRSLFDYFHGRSRLSTWLRALLARRHIDALRAGRRVRSLDAAEQPDELLEQAVAPPARPAADPDRAPDRVRLTAALQQALDQAVRALDANDRLRLAYYHVDEMTLAQIGRRFGEHEATVSRKLTRIRHMLREQIDRHLRETCRLGPDEIRDCYRAAMDDGAIAVRGLELEGTGAAADAAGNAAADTALTTPAAATPTGEAGPAGRRDSRRQESAAETF